jgi:hypothetical protein
MQRNGWSIVRLFVLYFFSFFPQEHPGEKQKPNVNTAKQRNSRDEHFSYSTVSGERGFRPLKIFSCERTEIKKYSITVLPGELSSSACCSGI